MGRWVAGISVGLIAAFLWLPTLCVSSVAMGSGSESKCESLALIALGGEIEHPLDYLLAGVIGLTLGFAAFKSVDLLTRRAKDRSR